ncbi:LexA family protein [Spirosoma fluminis]
MIADHTSRQLIPLYTESVQAGFTSPAEPHIERHCNLQDLCVAHAEATYFVRAVGESMIGDYIFTGSILVVDSTLLPPQTGDIIVAWVNGECCVKRFIRQNADMITLEPSNEKYKPIYVHKDRDQFRVLGKVVYIVSKPPKWNPLPPIDYVRTRRRK